MKKYIAIGHWKRDDNITSVASTANNLNFFKTDLKNNAFIAYMTLSEKQFNDFEKADSYNVFNVVAKRVSNYRRWNDVTDYICQCYDIMAEKIKKTI